MTSQEQEHEFSFKNLFVPFTTLKAIHWIVAIGIAVFANMLFNGFAWDDISQILNNPGVHSISNISSFFFSTHDLAGNLIKIKAIYYRPLMASVFALVYSVAGPNAFLYHLISLFLHISISVIIFIIFRRFFTFIIAFLLSLVFLIHPLNSESANYISAYNDLLYMFFGVIGLVFIFKKTLSMSVMITSSVCLFLSLLSKETGFLFIPIYILTIIFYQRKYLFHLLISLFFVLALYVFLRTTYYSPIPQNKVLGFSPFIHMSILQHLENVPKIFFYYLSNFFFPNKLSIAQHWYVQKLTIIDFYIPLVCFVSFTISNALLIFIFLKRKMQVKSVIFFTLWFWIGISLYFQFIVLDMTVADRWFYFPIVGLLGIIGSWFMLVSNKIFLKRILVVGIVLYIAILGIRTIIRNGNWYDEYTLYTHDLKIEKQSFDLENQLGIVLYNRGQYDLAQIHFVKSIALWSCSEAIGNLGYLYEKQGNFSMAEKDLLEAVNCNSERKSFGNLIILLYNENKLQEAKYFAKIAVNTYPDSSAFYYLLGLIDYKLGNKDIGIQEVKNAYELNGDPQLEEILMRMQHPHNSTKSNSYRDNHFLIISGITIMWFETCV